MIISLKISSYPSLAKGGEEVFYDSMLLPFLRLSICHSPVGWSMNSTGRPSFLFSISPTAFTPSVSVA